jgi:hypothetical protein
MPKRLEVEIPLLKAITRLGGEVDFSKQGRHLEIELAKEFGLPDEVRDIRASNYRSKGHRKWRNEIQFVRDQLVKKGWLDNSIWNKWRVTPNGHEQIEFSSTE